MKKIASDAAPMIELTDITKTYGIDGKVRALRDLNLRVAAGERVALMGPSGSGKTTVLNLICGLDQPSSGTVKVAGVSLRELSDDARTRLRREKIGMIFQTFNLLPTLTSLENVALPLRLQGVSRHEAVRRAGALLERTGLAERAAHRPDELSGGERQRVAIARALVFEPVVLLGDEPTGNLDSATGEEILDLLDEIYRERGCTVLMVTHDELVASRCRRIVTMRDGQIVPPKRPKRLPSKRA